MCKMSIFQIYLVMFPTLVIFFYQINLWWFSLGTHVSSTIKTVRHDITEVLLKVALNTITLTPQFN